MVVRSFISVVIETRQPSPMSPMRSASAMRTSVRYTSLNSASPVIWRSGRTSTPGACMSTMKYVRPLCFGRSGSVRGDEHAAVGEVRERVPHLLAVDDPLVAVAHRAGREAGEVGTRARLGEQLAPDLFAGEHRAQRALAGARRCRASRRSGPRATARRTACRAARERPPRAAAGRRGAARAAGGRGRRTLRGSAPTPARGRTARRGTSIWSVVRRVVLGEQVVDERVDACEVVSHAVGDASYFVVAMPPSTGMTAPVT